MIPSAEGVDDGPRGHECYMALMASFSFDFNAARLEMVSEDLKTQKGENPTKNGK